MANERPDISPGILAQYTEKGIIQVCTKHGGALFYANDIGCPICDLEGTDRIIKISKGKKPTKIVLVEKQEVKKPEDEKPLNFIEKIAAWSWKKKIIVIAILLVVMWLYLNIGAIMSWLK